jgi:hypothetical protein
VAHTSRRLIKADEKVVSAYRSSDRLPRQLHVPFQGRPTLGWNKRLANTMEGKKKKKEEISPIE